MYQLAQGAAALKHMHMLLLLERYTHFQCLFAWLILHQEDCQRIVALVKANPKEMSQLIALLRCYPSPNFNVLSTCPLYAQAINHLMSCAILFAIRTYLKVLVD